MTSLDIPFIHSFLSLQIDTHTHLNANKSLTHLAKVINIELKYINLH